MALTLAQMRTQVRSVVDIDSTDIDDTTLDTMIGQGFDLIVYSEKRWPFYEVRTTFNTADTLPLLRLLLMLYLRVCVT